MVMSQAKRYPNASLGLTLIEVLIALAIVSIAMTAIIKATSQNIRSTNYLKTKTTAAFVALEVINEARLGLINFSGGNENLSQKKAMLGQDWYWQGQQEETPNPNIKKIRVSVYNHPIENSEESPTVIFESYLYASKKE